ncbi:Glycosyltransferase, GT2 family [Oribacterium sp. KHPX15]|uniref:glycosyltransferase n=1 Tax=Oribacterium sp. KHPX15 TaxID=1855342 RepID=UPI00089A1500|nr:glycosyltransferase [Oribacterium sp. KHPX15]SEA48422.1 Glycosyltransferase, GT2 family [Oribacterium sp. KHPX15]
MNGDIARNVTVVIPVYDDWDTLKRCIESLKKHLDTRHKVILINDKGPDWEYLENKIIEEISNSANFVYEANADNMGFVKTCNRAVYELDKTDNDILLLNSDTEVTEGFLEEMLQVLYITEKHGVVCPRSNCATIYTIPSNKKASHELKPEESFRVYELVKGMLPRYSVMPTGVGFAFLIKRKLIKTYGLFDEIYSPGYNEENDFCMRINQYGYSVLAANRAFVYHYESRSFGSRRNELDFKHNEYLVKRYPYYPTIISMYQKHQIDPIDYFADLIGELYPKKRVLIDLYEVPNAYNGTAQYGLSFLQSFYRLYSEKYEIAILTNEAADKFHGISRKYSDVYHPDNIVGTFDIAYTPSQIINSTHWHLLNRGCLKYVFCMQDIISIRSNYLLVDDWERESIFEQSIQYADGIVFISDFSEEETRTYFNRIFDSGNIKTQVVYHGRFFDNEKEIDTQSKLPFDDYVVVIGNHYKHKNLINVLPELKNIKRNFIVIGNAYTGMVTDNIYGYQTGNLSNEFLRLLYRNCRAILFPSVYEGFGLPILTAIDFGKPIVVKDNELNRELIEYFDHDGKFVVTFNSIDEIDSCIEKALTINITDSPNDICNRSWDDVAEDVDKMLQSVLSEKIDVNRLYERWRRVMYDSNIHRCYVNYTDSTDSLERIKSRLRKHPRLYNFLKRIKNV